MLSADVSANLKNKVPKAAAQKVMMTLAGELSALGERQTASLRYSEKGILTKKEYGKQVIFVYNQVRQLVCARSALSAERVRNS